MVFEEIYKKKRGWFSSALLFYCSLIEGLHEKKQETRDQTRDLSVFSPVRRRAYME
jgi:hypothetical protein